MQTQSCSFFEQGVARLHKPLLPLVNIVQWLYLTGPFETIDDLLIELHDPIDMDHATYENPSALLTESLHALRYLEWLKRPDGETQHLIFSENLSTQLDGLEAVAQLTRHLVISHELEAINSLLCTEQGCTLCCTGPGARQKQLFFEIPLLPQETSLFTLPRHDSVESRLASPHDDTVFLSDSQPFYSGGPSMYHWRTGWSLILPKNSTCPQLDKEGACRIYPNRPEVCRRPQIFPYLLERSPDMDEGEKKAYVLRGKLLAVWDCPYVRRLKKDIATYAELCGLEPIFRQNKA